MRIIRIRRLLRPVAVRIRPIVLSLSIAIQDRILRVYTSRMPTHFRWGRVRVRACACASTGIGSAPAWGRRHVRLTIRVRMATVGLAHGWRRVRAPRRDGTAFARLGAVAPAAAACKEAAEDKVEDCEDLGVS